MCPSMYNKIGLKLGGKNVPFQSTHKTFGNSNPGVSIKFEEGSWLEKRNRLYKQGAVRPLNLGGSGCMLPPKI